MGKLSPAERQGILELVAEAVGGRVPLAVTVFGRTVEEQSAFVREAAAAGAAWVILQPPAIPDQDEAGSCISSAASRMRHPCPWRSRMRHSIWASASGRKASWSSSSGTRTSSLKGEGPAVEIEQVIRRPRAGFASSTAGAGWSSRQSPRRLCRHDPGTGLLRPPGAHRRGLRRRRMEEAEALISPHPAGDHLRHAVDPVPALLRQAADGAAPRLEPAEVHDREPALKPTPFGLAITRRLAAELGPYPGI